MHKENHYDWLDKHFTTFLRNLGVENPEKYAGMAGSHGDKCRQYRYRWEESGVPFNHGVAIYLLTHIDKWSWLVRETPDGWVAPCEWVIKVYPRFKKLIPRE